MTAPASLELGQTEVARELVPGVPGRVDAHVEALREQSRRFDSAAQTLRGVTAPHFTGRTATAFETRRDLLPPRWAELADHLDTMRSALTTYGAALSAAQHRAQDAIDTWRRGEAATRHAVRVYDDAVTTFNARRQAPGADPFARPPVFVDTGEALRREAEQILEAARESLAEAGDQACRAIGRLPGARHEGTAGVSSESGPIDPLHASHDLSDLLPGDHRVGDDLAPADSDADGIVDSEDADDDNDGIPDSRDPDTWRDHVQVDVAGWEGQEGYGAEGRVEDQVGGTTVHAEGELFAGARAEAGVGFDGRGANAHGAADVGVSASGGVGVEYGVGEVGATGEVFAGARAEGEVDVGLQGVHASGEAFAGARAEGSVSADVGGVGARGTAEGWAGVGVSGDVDAGYEDGEITIGFSGGAAVGLGGKLGGEITIDLPEVADTVSDAADAVGDFAGDAADALGDLAPDIDLPW